MRGSPASQGKARFRVTDSFFSMPTAPSTLLSAVRTFRARWLNREVSQVPSFDFRRSTGFLRGRFRSVRAENGQERWIRAISAWAGASLRLEARTLYIGPGTPWENGYIECFNGKLRDEMPDRDFYTLLEARALTERYRRTYNRDRPHSSLGYRRRRCLRPSCLPTLFRRLPDEHNGWYKDRGQVTPPFPKHIRQPHYSQPNPAPYP